MSLEAIRSHLPDLGCWSTSPEKEEGAADGANNNNFIVGDLGASQKDQFGPNLTPLHQFYKQQQQRTKMPGFRGRRGLCGCFQVSGADRVSSSLRIRCPRRLARRRVAHKPGRQTQQLYFLHVARAPTLR